MEIDHRLNGNLRRDVAGSLRLLHFLHLRIQTVDVRGMMLAVVELHDLAANRWLEGAIVICSGMLLAVECLGWVMSGRRSSNRMSIPYTTNQAA